MPPPKNSNSKPGTRHPTLILSQEHTGGKSFDMQTREVDKAMATTPNVVNSRPDGASSKPDDALNTLPSNGVVPFKHKKKFGKGKKVDGDHLPPNAEQPKPKGERNFENSSGTERLWKDRNDIKTWNYGEKSFENSFPQFEGPSRPPRVHSSSMSFHENQAPHTQPQEKPGYGFRSHRGDHRGNLRGNHRGNFTGRLHGHRKIFQGNESSTAPQQEHSHHVPPLDQHGFRAPSGNWYPHENGQSHPFMAQQMQSGHLPPFMHGVLPPPVMAMPMEIPSGSHFRPLPQPMPQDMQHPRDMPLLPHLVKPVTTPQSPYITPTCKTAKAQSTPSTASVETVIRATTQIPAGKPQHNGNEELHEIPPIQDPRPAYIRVDSLLTTIMAQLEQLKHRIDPTRLPEHRVVPYEMVRYLDTAMGLCKLTQKASWDLSEEFQNIKKQLNVVVHNANHHNAPSGHGNGSRDEMEEASAFRSQSVPPQDTRNIGSMAGGSKGSTPNVGDNPKRSSTKGNASSTTTSKLNEGFVIPISHYAGYFIDKSNCD